MRTITFLLIFFLIGAFYIISEKKLNVANGQDLSVLKSEYGDWLVKTVKGAVNLVGNVVSLEWLPKPGEETTNLSPNNSSGN